MSFGKTLEMKSKWLMAPIPPALWPINMTSVAFVNPLDNSSINTVEKITAPLKTKVFFLVSKVLFMLGGCGVVIRSLPSHKSLLQYARIT